MYIVSIKLISAGTLGFLFFIVRICFYVYLTITNFFQVLFRVHNVTDCIKTLVPFEDICGMSAIKAAAIPVKNVIEFLNISTI